MTNCLSCKDSGLCPFCNGSGRDASNAPCNYCKGSGKCVFCSGTSMPPQSHQHQDQINKSQLPTTNQQINSSVSTPPPRPNLESNQIQQYMNAYRKMLSQTQYFNALSGETPVEHYDDLLGQAMSSSKTTRYNATSSINFMAKYAGTTIPPLMPYFMHTLKYGTDREKIGACRLIEKMEDFSESYASLIGECLTHPSHSLRLQAAETLSKMKKHAVPAEKFLLDAAKSSSSQQIQKLATETLKNFRKLSKEEKEEIQRNEEQGKKLIEEMKKIEKQVASMKVDLPTGSKEFSQYKNVFFMSHALSDFKWVKKIIDEISTWPGCYCWTCERDISPGEDWLTEIYKGLEACNWYLLFWSDEAEKSKWTNEEIREAKTRNVSTGKPRLSVVNLGKNQWPLLLNRAQGAMIKSDEDLIQYLANLKSQVQF